MPDLKGFLSKLEEKDLLLKAAEPLSPEYGVSRFIADNDEGPALLFEVGGCIGRGYANTANTREKIMLALGAGSDEELYRSLRFAEENPGSLIEKSFEKRELSIPASKLPAVRFYEKDGGRYITSSIIIACNGDLCNASIHRMMLLDNRRFAVRLVPRHLYRLYMDSTSAGRDLPVAVVVGVHPLVELASATSPPLGVFELGIAARLLGGSLEVSRTPIYGIPVPRHAGFVLEGRLKHEKAEEGPFVDIMGTYDRVRRQPVLEVDAIYMDEESPYFHVILPGGMEHKMLMGLPREAAIWEAVSRVVPRVHKVRLTPASGGWLHAVVSITKNSEGDGKNAILAAFAAHPSIKHVVVVDGDIDPDDPKEVEWAIATRFQADRDLIVIPNARISSLDPSGRNGMGSKMGLDATKPVNAGPEFERARIPGG